MMPELRCPFRVHCQRGTLLLGTSGIDLHESVNGGVSWSSLGRLPLPASRRIAGATRLGRRMLRGGIHHIAPLGDSLVIIAHPHIFVRTDATGVMRLSLHRVVGSRPLTLCPVSSDLICYGEYRGFRAPRPIHVFASPDGLDWQPVYAFHDIGHIHGIFRDPYDGGIWITTGDSDSESGIFVTRNHFRTVDQVVGGSQLARTITLLFSHDCIYYGTDSHTTQNYFCRIARNTGKIDRIAEAPGSVFHGCRTANGLFFSTACEPNRTRRNEYATVWGSRDGERWTEVARFRKDPWHSKLFQYGQVFFAGGQEQSERLWLTPFATELDQSSLLLDPVLP